MPHGAWQALALQLSQGFALWLGTLLVLGQFYLAVWVLERLYPARAERQPLRHALFNLHYALYALALSVWLTAALTAQVTPAVRSGYAGWLNPAAWQGNLYAIGLFLVSLVAFDFLYYGFHRLQHTWPLLWRQHLLHHSEPSVNVTTGLRQHWLEDPLRVFFVDAPLLLLFATLPENPWWLASFSVLWNILLHANIRLGFGRFHLFLSSPQTHRIHHSLLPEHRDRNFAVFFPWIDQLFGTYYAPKPGEYPPTGVQGMAEIRSPLKALLLPFLNHRTALRGP